MAPTELYALDSQLSTLNYRVGEPNFAAMCPAREVLNTVVQSSIQLPQLGLPLFPRLFILAEFRIRQIGALEKKAASLIFDGTIEHFLQRSIGFLRHSREAVVRCGINTDREWHTNM